MYNFVRIFFTLLSQQTVENKIYDNSRISIRANYRQSKILENNNFCWLLNYLCYLLYNDGGKFVYKVSIKN